jgi:hypothetical protein
VEHDKYLVWLPAGQLPPSVATLLIGTIFRSSPSIPVSIAIAERFMKTKLAEEEIVKYFIRFE